MTKHDIIRKALQLLMEKGPAIFSMDMLAKKMRISKKTIYKHYASRSELEDACIQLFFTSMKSNIPKPVLHENITVQEYTLIIKQWFSRLSEQITQIRISALIGIEDTNPMLWEKINNKRQVFIQENLQPLIAYGIKNRLINQNLTEEFIINTLLFIITNMATPKNILHSGGQSNFINQITTLLLQGIIKES